MILQVGLVDRWMDGGPERDDIRTGLFSRFYCPRVKKTQTKKKKQVSESSKFT